MSSEETVKAKYPLAFGRWATRLFFVSSGGGELLAGGRTEAEAWDNAAHYIEEGEASDNAEALRLEEIKILGVP